MKKLLILTFAILTAVSSSKAAVITQTVDFGSFTNDGAWNFSQFNTALGDLTSVTLNWTLNSAISSAAITNQNTGTVTVTKVSFVNTLEGYLFNEFSDSNAPQPVEFLNESKNKSVTPVGGKVLTQGQTYNIGSVSFTQVAQEDSFAPGDAYFDNFKGTGDVPVYLTTTFGATPTASGSGSNMSWLTSITGASAGTLEVTYTYNAAIAPVPEPSALILGCGGLFFMTAFAIKKRRISKVKTTDSVA